MRRRELEAFLKEYNFKLVRQKRHLIYSNGSITVVLPTSNMINLGLAKRIMLQAQGKNFQTNRARQ